MGMIRTLGGGSPMTSSTSLSRFSDANLTSPFSSLSRKNNKSFEVQPKLSLKRNSVEFSSLFKRISSSEFQKIESTRRSSSGSSLGIKDEMQAQKTTMANIALANTLRKSSSKSFNKM